MACACACTRIYTSCSQCGQNWIHGTWRYSMADRVGTVWLIALWRNQWHTRYISITATWTLDRLTGHYRGMRLQVLELPSKFWCLDKQEVKCKIWDACKTEKRDWSHKSLPPVILGKSGEGLRLSRHSFLPMLIELWTPRYQPFSYIILHMHRLTLSYYITHTPSYIILHMTRISTFDGIMVRISAG